MDIVFATQPEAPPRLYSDYADELEERLKLAYSDVRRHLGVAATRNKRRYDMRVKPEEFKVGEKVLYFSPRKYQGYQDKWLRKFTGAFEVVKLLGPVNVVLRKSAKSTPFTTHVDKLRKLPTDQTDPNGLSEQAQEQEGNNMDVIACVDISPAASLNKCQNTEASYGRKRTTAFEAQDSCRSPDNSNFVPDTQFEEGNEENRRPRRHRKLPLRFRE